MFVTLDFQYCYFYLYLLTEHYFPSHFLKLYYLFFLCQNVTMFLCSIHDVGCKDQVYFVKSRRQVVDVITTLFGLIHGEKKCKYDMNIIFLFKSFCVLGGI